MTTAGRVVILNGTSSSGKSTLARRFRAERAARGECWIVVALDDFLALLPPQWYETPEHHGPFGHQGIAMESSPAGTVIHTGEVGDRLLTAYRRTVAVCAHAGFDVVVDEVVLDEESVADWSRALEGLWVTWVAIRCSPEVAEERERARHDRLPGLARGLAGVVHRFAPAHHELDTSELNETEAAQKLASLVEGSGAAQRPTEVPPLAQEGPAG